MADRALTDEQASPGSPPAEQPADDGVSGDSATPQAEPQENVFGLPDTRTPNEIFCDNVWLQIDKCATVVAIEAVEARWKPSMDKKLGHEEWVAFQSRIDRRKMDLLGAAA